MPEARTIYSHSTSFPFTLTPDIRPFFVKILSTGEFSKIFAPSNLAALASIWVTPTGSAEPSPGIKIPPIIFFSLII